MSVGAASVVPPPARRGPSDDLTSEERRCGGLGDVATAATDELDTLDTFVCWRNDVGVAVLRSLPREGEGDSVVGPTVLRAWPLAAERGDLRLIATSALR